MNQGSQHGQDEWVLSHYSKGTFLDVGCGDGQFLSNTLKLESLGWEGIAIDAFPKNFESRIHTRVVSAVVYSLKNKVVQFLVPQEAELAGIVSHLTDLHRESVLATPHQFKTIKTELLHEILDGLEAPRFIEYLSLDIEGAEYEVLKVFPFDRYRFGCMTIEHNYQEPQRSLVRSLLAKHGYSLARSVKCDDWFLSDSLVT